MELHDPKKALDNLHTVNQFFSGPGQAFSISCLGHIKLRRLRETETNVPSWWSPASLSLANASTRQDNPQITSKSTPAERKRQTYLPPKKKDKKLQILSPSKTCPSKTHKEISQIPEVDTKITTAPAETKLFPDQNSTRIKTPLQLQNMIFKMFSG